MTAFLQQPAPFLRGGGLSVEGNASATALPTQNAWVQYVHFDTDQPSRGATPANATDDITIDIAGTYLVGFHASFEATMNETFEVEAQKNNGVTRIPSVHAERKIGASSDIGAMAAANIVTLAVADTIELWARCLTVASASITIKDCGLYVVRLW